MSDVYSHGQCFICKEQHDEKVLQKTSNGKNLCPTCFGQYEDDADPTWEQPQLPITPEPRPK